MSEPRNDGNEAREPRSGSASVHLPKFWAKSPAAWFRAADAQFILRHVTCPLEKYYLVLTALTEVNVDRVQAIVEAEPDEESFEKLRAALVASHTLTPYQQVDALVNMEPLGARKPSELLAAMDKHKPKNMNSFYAYHFLQRLPREIRVLLARDDLDDMAALAEKADSLMAMHQPQLHDTVAAVCPAEQPAATATVDEEAVAAIGGKGQSKKKKRKDRKQRRRTPSPNSIKKSPLCWAHIRYGDKAFSCEQPCAWPEN
jgi:hypothetical protein